MKQLSYLLHHGVATTVVVVLIIPRAFSAKVEDPPYHLPFDYDPFSETGPSRWGEVNVTGNEWMKYVGGTKLTSTSMAMNALAFAAPHHSTSLQMISAETTTRSSPGRYATPTASSTI